MRAGQYAAFFFSEYLRSESNHDKNYFDFQFISSRRRGWARAKPRAGFVPKKAAAHDPLRVHLQQNPEDPAQTGVAAVPHFLHVRALARLVHVLLLHRQPAEHAPRAEKGGAVDGGKHRLRKAQGRGHGAEVG